MKRLMTAAVLLSSSLIASASEFETMKAGSGLEAISAEALQQAPVPAVPAPMPENAGRNAGALLPEGPAQNDGFEAMSVAAMEKLYEGYLVLESRSVYEGGDENADELLRLRGKAFKARGLLRTTLSKKFPFRTVCNVYLATMPEQTPYAAVYLRSETFFSEERAKKYQESLATGVQGTVYFTVQYNYSEITNSPFRIFAELGWGTK